MAMRYETWMRHVDDMVQKLSGGIDRSMLPDSVNFYELWASDVTPREAAAVLLEREGMGMLLPEELLSGLDDLGLL